MHFLKNSPTLNFEISIPDNLLTPKAYNAVY